MTAQEFSTRSQEWLRDAKLLNDAGHYENAVYLLGYAVEFALKARMCRHLLWDVYRDDLPGMKSHVLPNLLSYTGLGESLFDSGWNYISDWSPEIRYSGRKVTAAEVADAIAATEKLLDKIL